MASDSGCMAVKAKAHEICTIRSSAFSEEFSFVLSNGYVNKQVCIYQKQNFIVKFWYYCVVPSFPPFLQIIFQT